LKRKKEEKNGVINGNNEFIQYNWDTVKSKFGISIRKISDDLFPLATITKSKLEKFINEMKEDFKKIEVTIGCKMDEGKEAVRCEYISTFIINILFEFSEKLSLHREFNIVDSFLGPIEYVITPKTKETPLFMIIVAKKDDFEQGRAKLYMQLHNASKMNKEKTEIYGAYTNALTWYFVKYDSSKFNEKLDTAQDKDLFVESNPITLQRDDFGLAIKMFIGISSSLEK